MTTSIQTEHPQVSASVKEALHLRNGASAPLDALPLFSRDAFAHWLLHLTHNGCRPVAFFPLPVGGKSQTVQLAAVLASDTDQRLLAASFEVEGSYPSFTPRVPSLHLFERELFEQTGILPEGHPWLKPVRFEKIDGPDVGVADFFRVEGDDVHEVAVGPIHAGVIECGHFRFQCLGEVVMHLEISLGYHHRGVERMLLSDCSRRALGLMEAVSGDATIAHSWAYCSVIEALADVAPLPGHQLIRSLALEFERLANHTGDLGALAGDVGFLPTLAFCGRLRGDFLNMSALLCGSRFGRGLLTPGGTRFGTDAALCAELKNRLLATARDVDGAAAVMWSAPSVMARMTGTGTVKPADAAALGLVGPAARACGFARDARHSHPLPNLPQPPEMQTLPWGDVLARTRVRHEEIRASVAYCRRLLDEFLKDAGDPGTLMPANPRLAPSSIAVALTEARHGEVCHTAVTDGNGTTAAYKITDASFHNWMGLALALREQQISDFPLCNKSFNLSYCGHDL